MYWRDGMIISEKRPATPQDLEWMEGCVYNGCVQLGKVSLWIGPRDERGSCEYIVSAPVIPYYGLTPKSGVCPWILQHGRTTDSDSDIRDRNSTLYRDGMLVHAHRCQEKHWPYEKLK